MSGVMAHNINSSHLLCVREKMKMKKSEDSQWRLEVKVGVLFSRVMMTKEKQLY